MPIYDLFSKRRKRLKGDVPDVLVYDIISQKLKVQIVHIVRDAFGEYTGYYQNSSTVEKAFKTVQEAFCREYGLFHLGTTGQETYQSQVLNYLLNSRNVEEIIDIVELCFQYIIGYIEANLNYYRSSASIKLAPQEAVQELNDRFKEHGVGYQFDGGRVIRFDSTYVHSEITKPVISLLWNSKFIGANEEYFKAHEHYRHGRNKECLTECLKAFESAMKIICKEKGWAFNKNDTSRKLIQVCFKNQLVPTFTQNQFTSLQNLLESGVPTIRNKLGGHGQGAIPQKVDDEMARYGLNLVGVNIIFLVEQSGIKG